MQDDPGYLKIYVRQHPDNKMAWYLLGKAYEEQGKAGKAKYCYKQAGEIYEAYENRKVPGTSSESTAVGQLGMESESDSDRNQTTTALDPELEAFLNEPEEDTDGYVDKRSPSRTSSATIWWKVTTIVLLLLFLFLIPMWPESELTPPPSHTNESDPASSISDPPATTDTDNSGPEPPVPDEIVRELSWMYLTDPFAANRVREVLSALILDVDTPSRIVLAQAATSADNRWALWEEEPTWLATVEPFDDGGKLVSAYDPRLCECTPASNEQGLFTDAFHDWQRAQEQKWVVEAAVQAYREQYGRLPEQIDQLTRDYPNNMLPGYTDEMKHWFDQLAAMEESAAMSDADETSDTGLAMSPESAESGLLFPGKTSGQPLEIVVDTARHRLALIKGNVIIRTFEVGLGGDSTPTGEFVISEKVKNPNGGPDGEFGSRGMTLSDTLYAIHGTDEPESIGLDMSLGCIRMHNEDIEELYDMTPIGTTVTIGSHNLPVETTEMKRTGERFFLPAMGDETNDDKVYHWLY